jgi:hypothetical protein
LAARQEHSNIIIQELTAGCWSMNLMDYPGILDSIEESGHFEFRKRDDLGTRFEGYEHHIGKTVAMKKWQHSHVDILIIS